jgi:DMSO reductase anchor subunit
MSRHKSLVAFTLLIQSAVGSIWCIGISLLRGDTPFRYGWHAAIALLVVLAGLCFSVGHLGRPGVCFYTIRNLKYSWLSREIAASVTLTAAVAAMAFTGLGPGGLSGWVVLAASAVGGLVLYAMARAYGLRTVPSWNHAGTLLDFLGSALLLGGLQFGLAERVLVVILNVNHDASGTSASGYLAFMAVLIGFVLKVLARAMTPAERAESAAGPLKMVQPLIQGCGIVLWALSMLLGDDPGLRWVLLLSAAAGLVAGEINLRNRYYASYHRAGL